MGDAEPRVVSEGPAWAILDGGSALGQVIGVRAMDEAIVRARRSGVAYVGVRNSNHFGAAGYFAARAARAGLFGMAMANDTPSVAAPGSRGPSRARTRLPMRSRPAIATRSSSTSP